MSPVIAIRDERDNDCARIRAVICAAFAGRDEADLVDALRCDGDLALSLVADGSDGIVGYLAMSRLIAPTHGLALAPLAVAPASQRQGVGSLLVRTAMQRAHDLGCRMIFVLGDPAYYARFGFSPLEAANFTSPYSGPHFMATRLGAAPCPPGPVTYARAFSRLT